MSPNDSRHGTYAGANVHWETGVEICQPCKKAATRYQKERNLRLLRGDQTIVPADVAMRKIRALVAIGHGYAAIGRHIGAPREQVRSWGDGHHRSLSLDNAERIYAAFNALNMVTPRPVTQAEKRAVTLAKNLAKRNRWVGPMEWLDIDLGVRFPSNNLHEEDKTDHVLIDRIVGGDASLARVATRAEKDAVVLRWKALDRSLAELERMTGWAAHRYGRQSA